MSQKLIITRKSKPSNAPLSQGKTNGTSLVNGTGNKRKRELDEPEDHQEQTMKRGKVETQSKDDEVLILDESSNGAILIEDD